MLFFLLNIKNTNVSWQQSLVEDKAQSQTLQNFNHYFNTDLLYILQQISNAQEKKEVREAKQLHFAISLYKY